MREAYASRGGVKFFCKAHPTPTLTAFASTLPLQGRVKRRAWHPPMTTPPPACFIRLRLKRASANKFAPQSPVNHG